LSLAIAQHDTAELLVNQMYMYLHQELVNTASSLIEKYLKFRESPMILIAQSMARRFARRVSKNIKSSNGDMKNHDEERANSDDGNPGKGPLAILNKALTLQTASPHTWFQMGNAALEDHKYSDAIECFTNRVYYSLSEGDPSLHTLSHPQLVASALGNLGMVAMLASNLGEPSSQNVETILQNAISAFGDSATEPKPHLCPILNSLGTLHKQRGQYQKAREVYQKSLAINPKHGPTLNNLGLLLIAEGKRDEAKEMFLSAIEADPKLDGARVNLQQLALLKNQ